MANIKGRKLVPMPAKKQQPKGKTKPKAIVPRSVSIPKDVAAYARLLADPCVAPYQAGMIGNGQGSYIGRFTTDFTTTSGATQVATVVCVCPTGNVIYHAHTDSGTANLTFGSAFPFPGSAKTSTASRFRVLSACAEVMWTGSELNRAGHVAMGNAPLGAGGSPSTSLTADEIRTGLPYIVKLPDAAVGIKWRPNERDLEWQTPATESTETALWLQVAGHPVSTQLRWRVTAVVEWDDPIQLGSGVTHNQYAPPSSGTTDVWSRALSFLDKTGHWLLTNAEAIGHKSVEVAKLLM